MVRSISVVKVPVLPRCLRILTSDSHVRIRSLSLIYQSECGKPCRFLPPRLQCLTVACVVSIESLSYSLPWLATNVQYCERNQGTLIVYPLAGRVTDKSVLGAWQGSRTGKEASADGATPPCGCRVIKPIGLPPRSPQTMLKLGRGSARSAALMNGEGAPKCKH